MTRETKSIVADIGGTNARFAVVNRGEKTIKAVHNFACTDYKDISTALDSYLDLEQISKADIDAVCLAVAAVADEEYIRFLNNSWSFHKGALEAEIALPLIIINDWEAQARCIPYIDRDKDILIDAQNYSLSEGVSAFMGPGTGLGVSALLPSGDVLTSEGGHASFAPTSAHQMELLTWLQKRFTRVSIERILSGPGLENLLWANSNIQGFAPITLPAKDIVSRASNGDALCTKVVEDFVTIAASVSGDICLMMGANSLYFCGGIMPKILPLIDQSLFRQNFKNKGRYTERCANIPIHLITDPYSGLLGCIPVLEKYQQNTNISNSIHQNAATII